MSSVLRRAVLTVFIVGALLAPVLPAHADTPKEAAEFVNDLVGKALGILADKNMGKAERDAAFSTLLTANFDVPRISRFVLGRYWAGASDAERSQFIDTYREFVIRSYASRFSEYTGESVKVTTTRPESETVTVVNSDIVHPNGDPPVKVSWRVYKGGDGFKIVDVDVEGVSMMVTQREEFASVIQRNGGTVAGLTKAIQQKISGGG